MKSEKPKCQPIKSGRRIRVLVVDDSLPMRKLFAQIIKAAPDLELVGEANNVYVARERLVALRPDVMVLAVDMPKMDGITFLEKVMQYFPTRTLMINGSTTQKSETFLRALSAGAIDVIDRPQLDSGETPDKNAEYLIAERLRTVFRSSLQRSFAPLEGTPNKRLSKAVPECDTKLVVGIAASTGGTEALKVLLGALPPEIPPILIVQHMPVGFTKGFAAALNRGLPFLVKEAEDQEPVGSGKVLIAPGGFHLEVAGVRGTRFVRLHQLPALHNVRPSADYLFSSLAQSCGRNSLGIVLTGIGRDGVDGLSELKRSGGCTIAQTEESCVVFGMPQAALQMNIIDQSLNPLEIAAAISQLAADKKYAA